MMVKLCRGCDTEKPLEEFHLSSRNRNGRQSRCRQCQCAARRAAYDPARSAEYDREYRATNRERDLERKVEYHRDNPILERLRRGKNRAREAGVPFDDVTVDQVLADWYRRGISPDRDVYTGEPLVDGWHLDHAVPLSAPGTPGHVVTNLVPCNPGTNTGKGRRVWLDYLADRAEEAEREQTA